MARRPEPEETSPNWRVGTVVMGEGYIQRSLNHHEGILPAPSSRDAEAASEAMWVHPRISVGAFFEARDGAPRSMPEMQREAWEDTERSV